MILAGALTLAGVGFAVPPAVQQVAYALIGLQVGLRFTLETVRRLGRLLPVLAGLFGLLAPLAVRRPAGAGRGAA